MNIRILSIAAAAAFAITSLGSLAPVNAAPFGSAGQAITAPANDLVIQVGKKGKGKWKGHKGKNWKFGKGKHFKLHIGKGYYHAGYPYWCWEKTLVPTKHGYVEKVVFVCY
jgi:hypothetical protein